MYSREKGIIWVIQLESQKKSMESDRTSRSEENLAYIVVGL